MSEKKNLQIERIRAIATMAVVAIHTINSGLIYKGSTYSQGMLDAFVIIKNLLYWAVPCFGMITGYLLLNPEKEISISKIYGKYLTRTLLVLGIFGTAFSWIEIIFSEKTISVTQLVQAFQCVITNKSWAHLWYMYALITVYLVMPLYRWISKKRNNAILIGVTMTVMVLMVVLKSRELSVHFYVLLGEIYRRKILNIKRKQALIITSVISGVIASLAFASSVYSIEIPFVFGYTSLLVAIQSYSMFCMLYDALIEKNRGGYRLFKEISEKSFGIYLFHMIFVNCEYQALHIQIIKNPVSFFVMALLTLINIVLAFFITMITKHMPLIKQIV